LDDAVPTVRIGKTASGQVAPENDGGIRFQPIKDKLDHVNVEHCRFAQDFEAWNKFISSVHASVGPGKERHAFIVQNLVRQIDGMDTLGRKPHSTLIDCICDDAYVAFINDIQIIKHG
jgi:hypothetical protein